MIQYGENVNKGGSALKYDVFLICPVRAATEEQKERMAAYIKELEEEGKKVYYPARDTNQQDHAGYRICSDNSEAIKNSREVHVFFDPHSQGSLFDLGVAFALGKKLVIVNREEVQPTDGKSFANMMILWSQVTS